MKNVLVLLLCAQALFAYIEGNSAHIGFISHFFNHKFDDQRNQKREIKQHIATSLSRSAWCWGATGAACFVGSGLFARYRKTMAHSDKSRYEAIGALAGLLSCGIALWKVSVCKSAYKSRTVVTYQPSPYYSYSCVEYSKFLDHEPDWSMELSN